MSKVIDQFAQGYADASTRIAIKKERKALRKTPEAAEFVTLRATGMRELQIMTSRGWTIATAVPLGRGAGFTSYIMQKARAEVVGDLS